MVLGFLQEFLECKVPVHDTAANQSESKKGWTGELEHLELPVADDEEDGDQA